MAASKGRGRVSDGPGRGPIAAVLRLAGGSLLRRTVIVFVSGYVLTIPAIYLVYWDQERAYHTTREADRAGAARADIATLMGTVADQRLALDRYQLAADPGAAQDFLTGRRREEALRRVAGTDAAGTGLERQLTPVDRALDAWEGWADAAKADLDLDRRPLPSAVVGEGPRRYEAVRQRIQAFEVTAASRVTTLQQASDSQQQIAIRDNTLTTVAVIAVVSMVVAVLLGTMIRSIGRLATTAHRLSSGERVPVPYVEREDQVGALARSLAHWQHAENARWAATAERNVLLEQAPVGICRLDVQGRLATGNEALLTMLGRNPVEVMGSSVVDLVHGEDRAGEAEGYRLLASGELNRRSAEIRLLRPDGGLLWCNTVTTPLRSPTGELEGFIVIVEDISDRKRQGQRAAQIQRQLLPQIAPLIPGYDLAGACLPAEDVAGDFYDWMVTDAGQVDVTVADVMGKGVGAALVMAALRTALRSAPEKLGPAEQVSRAAASMPLEMDDEGLFATVFHAHLDVNTGQLRYVDAGHGYCAIRRSSGAMMRLPVRSLPVGAPSDEPFREGSISLSPGDTLLVYSDGLVETPDRTLAIADFTVDLDRSRDARDMVRRLMARVPSRPLDDVTILALHHLANGDASERLALETGATAVALDLDCEADDQLGEVHAAMARFWEALRPAPAETWRMLFELAVAEVAANIIEHARPALMSLRLHLDAGCAVAHFSYLGMGWTDLPNTDLPDMMAERGRGLFLARTGVDEVTYQRTGMTVDWRLVKRL